MDPQLPPAIWLTAAFLAAHYGPAWPSAAQGTMQRLAAICAARSLVFLAVAIAALIPWLSVWLVFALGVVAVFQFGWEFSRHLVDVPRRATLVELMWLVGHLIALALLIRFEVLWSIAVGSGWQRAYTDPATLRVVSFLAVTLATCRIGCDVVRAILSAIDRSGADRAGDQPGAAADNAAADDEAYDANAGRLIGYLERILILILAIGNHFGAVGFVIAAKSMARYKRMETDRQFAERYLVGTLLSALIALIGAWLYTTVRDLL